MNVYCEGNISKLNTGIETQPAYNPTVNCTYNQTGTYTDFLYIYDLAHLGDKSVNISVPLVVTNNPACFNSGEGGEIITGDGITTGSYFVNNSGFETGAYQSSEFDWDSSGCDNWNFFYILCPPWTWFVQSITDLFDWVFSGFFIKLLLAIALVILVVIIVKRRM